MGIKLRLSEVVERYGRSQSYWRALCDRNQIRHYKDGPQDERMLDVDDIEAFWEARKVEPDPSIEAHPVDRAIAASEKVGL